MERTAFMVDNVSETSSNTRETQCSGSTAVRHVCAPSVCSVTRRRGSALQRGVPGEPCEGEPVRRHPHPGAVRVSETPARCESLFSEGPAPGHRALPSPCSVVGS